MFGVFINMPRLPFFEGSPYFQLCQTSVLFSSMEIWRSGRKMPARTLFKDSTQWVLVGGLPYLSISKPALPTCAPLVLGNRKSRHLHPMFEKHVFGKSTISTKSFCQDEASRRI